jgi:transcription termination/antitermination protein NusG
VPTREKGRQQTQGGEALLNAEPSTPQVTFDGSAGRAQWFALWVRSHFEQLVQDQLSARGFRTLLPTSKTWSRRGGKRHVIPVPMFPGYLFLHHAMDKHGYVQVLQARGVVRILGERWDRLVPIDDAEIAAVQQLATAEVHVLPHPYLREGHRVRIVDGPLNGLEGVLLRVKPGKGLLVVSVELLHRSVAVEVDCTGVVSIGDPPPSRAPMCRYTASTAPPV